MHEDTGLLFQFADSNAASLASGTFQELGYDPVIQQGSEVHIHMRGDDITSALEIAQSHGGQLTVESSIPEISLTNEAYRMENITIPAHVVNEDWIAQEETPDSLRNHDDDAPEADEFFPDDGSYGYFSGDVHI
ncbi:hypothetical protein [Paenibacillus sacheonensis]|uniref:Uncharacterized protein n=1 Tax=Paenibacillus sacheonensis TaxID=742054 RepID=A0A7X5C348_9BACL|nr:hypothetical protein [Paenibacillus sacheonensis]MBM7567726.1 hypothetical protein [Paenibacillus sacheonensis]NBC72000.1 hypothetical protein [Paenibacillus sacheonensis]